MEKRKNCLGKLENGEGEGVGEIESASMNDSAQRSTYC